ncbi:MAG: Ig-like domain-containing protein, partial [Bacteroidales bacterium]|nr:Ig-like domain-containing protein [Bacteroidales bacterium]
MKTYLIKILAVALVFATVSCNKDKNVTGVTLEPATIALTIDETATLTATVHPADAVNKAISWTSSHPEIAAVSNGTVTAKFAGTTTITVTTQDGGFTAKCVVTVTQTEPEEVGVLISGVIWATRNLASHGKFVERPEDYGAFFQWGRKGDGHEQRTSSNYPTNDYSQENGVVSGTGLDAHG